MVEIFIYNFRNYKEYLNDLLKPSGESRGLRSRLAEHLNCQTAYISQVLNGQTDFSLEHAMRISEFLKLSSHEAHYLMLLVHHSRAGSSSLKEYYLQQIENILSKRQEVSERIQAKSRLSEADEIRYYSSWIYVAIHIMLSVPELQTKVALSKHLNLPLELISECLNYLVTTGLAKEKEDHYVIGETRIHIPKSSPLTNKHHINWRLQAMQALDIQRKSDLHYSAVVSLSRADAEKWKSMLLDFIEKTEPILRDSKEESVYCFATDFFEI